TEICSPYVCVGRGTSEGTAGGHSRRFAVRVYGGIGFGPSGGTPRAAFSPTRVEVCGGDGRNLEWRRRGARAVAARLFTRERDRRAPPGTAARAYAVAGDAGR